MIKTVKVFLTIMGRRKACSPLLFRHFVTLTDEVPLKVQTYYVNDGLHLNKMILNNHSHVRRMVINHIFDNSPLKKKNRKKE